MNDQLEKYGYHQELKRVLPLSSLVYYGIAYMVPMAFFGSWGIANGKTHGMLALTYFVTTVAMGFTAFSYKFMVKAYPVAGSAYTYVQRSINPHMGFLSGWVILMDYMLLPMLNYIVAASFISAALPGVPRWVGIILLLVICTMVNYFGIRVASNVNNIIVWLQIIFLAAFLFFTIRYIAGGGGAGTIFDMSAFYNSVELSTPGMGWSVIFGGASILALSFLGFDAISTISEEAINPEVNVGRAIVLSCVIAGIGFITISYFLQLSWPTAWIETDNSDAAIYELVNKVASPVMANLSSAIYVVALIACSSAAQASGARVLYGMGRDGIIPQKFFAHLHEKHKSPSYNVLLIGTISLTALFLSLETAISLVNFGALFGFTLVNLSVIAHYFIKNKQRKGIDLARYLITPLCGAAFTFTLWISLDIHSKILGFSWLTIGIIYLAIKTSFFRKLPPEMHLEG